jgi:beta-lactamase regulating signal transducer with metallopeptidase domain
LWQGFALTLAMSAVIRLLPRANAATRYWMWWGTLGALGALGAAGTPGVMVEGGAQLTHLSNVTYLFEISSAPDSVLAVFLGVWIGVALVLLIRILPAIHAVYALRDRCRHFPEEVEAQLPLWCEARDRGPNVRPAALMLCDAAPGATVLGFQHACIAIPPSWLTSLTLDELDQIVLHEYAHVQRWDDWARLAQTLLQSALWIHPAIAFVGRRLNLEREMACDEWVVARTGLPNAYARCLTRAAEVRGRQYAASALSRTTHAVLGPTLLNRRRDLVQRVDRLLAIKGRTRRNVSATAAFGGACALVVISLELRAIPLVGESRSSPLPVAGAAGWGLTPVQPVQVPDWVLTPVQVRARLSPLQRPTSASFGESGEAVTLQIVESEAEEGITSVVARSFEGRYDLTADVKVHNHAPGAWQKGAAAGTSVAEAAQKAGMGLAQTFTRAGVSLVRRF